VGSATGDPLEGNVIAANYWGVFVKGPNNTVAANYVGTNAAGSGTTGLGNTIGIGVFRDHNIIGGANTIGDSTVGAGNLVSGNPYGIYIQGAAATDNWIAGNYIGTDATGSFGLGNGSGVVIDDGASNNTIGGAVRIKEGPPLTARNIISGNG